MLAAIAGLIALCAVAARQIAASGAAIGAAETPDGARLTPVPCWFDVAPFERVGCAQLVPSDARGRATPITLPVVVLRGTRARKDRAPLVYLTGGPGDSIGLEPDDMPAWRAWRDRLGNDGDLILLDPRGTGRATPRLDCPAIGRLTRELLAQRSAPRDEFDRSLAVLRVCAETLAAHGVSLRDFSTARSARDVGELLALLGVRDAHLYGVSYGTRLALAALRASPDRIAAVVLDSVYPPDIDGFESWPAVLDGAFARLVDACASHAACSDRYRGLGASLERLFARLRDTPLTLDVRDPSGSGRLHVVVDDRRAVSVLFDALYRRERMAGLPSIIEAVSEGRGAPIAPLVEDWVAGLLSPLASDLAYTAVECQDRAPRESRAAYAARVDAHPRVAFALRDDWDLDVCVALGLPEAGDDVRAPVSSAVPALLLGGAYDPVTPVSFAQHAATTLARATLAVLPRASHGVVDGDACGQSLMAAFLADPDERPTLSCVARSEPFDFIIDAGTAIDVETARPGRGDFFATDLDLRGRAHEVSRCEQRDAPARVR